MLTFGELFAGVGGFSLGLEAAGWTPQFQVEIDEKARAVLRHRWPHINQFTDVRTFPETPIAPPRLLCGGSPCQDVSQAGRRDGLAGARSGLFFEFARIAGELKPQWILLENVPGLLSSKKGKDFDVVIGTLCELGYGVQWRVLDSRGFGVPQRRRRVFIVGYLGGPCPGEILFEPESLCGNPEASRGAWERPTESPEGGLGEARDGVAFSETSFEGWHPSKDVGLYAHEEKEFHTIILKGSVIGRNSLAGPNGFFREQHCYALQATEVHAVGFHIKQDPVSEAEGRAALGSTSGGMGVLTHQLRRLLPLECERLQGWPDDHTKYGILDSGKPVTIADGPRYRMCGNGVTSSVVEWIGRRIREFENA